MLDHPLLMQLLAPRDQRGRNRDSAAAADVARQIDQAGGVAGLGLARERECNRIDGNEQKRETETLHYARAHSVSELICVVQCAIWNRPIDEASGQK